MQISEYAALYRDNLLNSVIPFWVNNSPDKEYGGYSTCLDTAGKVYDTDKFIWLQCRQVWCFAMLYNRVEQKQEWLDLALHGAQFLMKNGRDDQGNWYFSLDRTGKPLVQPYNIFSDCFATMAFGQLYLATQNEEYATIAKNTFDNILKRADNTKGQYNKAYPGTRPMQNFALPMILCNLVSEIETLLPAELVTETIAKGIHTVMDVFYLKDKGLILENTSPDGEFVDCFEGRLLNPGHGIEAMWFIMDLAEKQGDTALIRKATDITLSILEYAWDAEHEGIFYFLDIAGHPPEKLEWDQKLWWVHVETLISLAKGYLHTGDERCWKWFEKVHNYTWKHFVDTANGEWFGYLNREGKVLLPLKGGKWKGCFHVPRGLYQLWKTMERLNEKNAHRHNMANIPLQNVAVSNTSGSKSNYTLALVSLAVLYFMMGFITCLNDSLVPFFRKQFTLNYSQSSLVQFYFFLTYGLMSVPAGKVVERTGYKMGMVIGFVIAAIGALLFYPASLFHRYELFLAALFIVAIGIVLLQVAANPYVTVLGKPETASSRLTLIQGVGSIGTTVAPVFGAAFILAKLNKPGVSAEAVRAPYLFIAAVLCIIAIILFRLKLPVIQTATAETHQTVKGKGVFAHRNLNLGILAIFAYVGAEVAIGTFLTNYIADVLRIADDQANFFVAFYWGGMLAGRLAGALALKKLHPPVALVIVSVLAVVFVGCSVLATGYAAVWLMVAVGLCNSIMFAVIFSLSVSGLQQHTTKASGLLSSAIAGGAIISYSQGGIKDNFSWQIAFIVPLVCYLYLVFYGLNGYRSKFSQLTKK